MPKIHVHPKNKENQDEMTQVSPPYVRKGVLRVRFKPTEPRKGKSLVNTREKPGSEMAT